MQFLEYKDKLIKDIKRNLVEAKKSCSVESIHDLRVGIKRLRSIFRILSDIDNTLKKKQFNQSLRKLFKAAGNVRDLHIAEELIWKWSQEALKQVNEYFNYLKENEFDARSEFMAVSKDFRMKSLDEVSATISKHFSAFEEHKLKELIGQNSAAALDKIATHKNGKLVSFEALHKLRIETKDARYRLQIYMLISEQKDELNVLDTWLRDLHRSIGLWHDYVVAAEKLHSFLTHDIVKSVKSPESYEALAGELQKRADESYAKFNEVWKDEGNVLGGFLEQRQPATD